jgi:AcrR family transcriptional regulator
MGRKAGSSGSRTAAAIRKAGLELIFRHGYEAMTLRQLAAEVGLQQASLYNHIQTKQDLLFELIKTHMDALLAALAEVMRYSGTPTEQLRRFVDFHVTYHVERKQEVFISYSELRSLSPDHYAVVIKMREAYEQVLIKVLRDGTMAGDFTVSDPKITAYGILAMLSGVCTWFDPAGRLSRQAVCALYSDMAVGAVAFRG